ncbi:MAG TPA: LPS assembly lipoprotein LptE [Longimicrobium sp.]|jgi:outer membrane lipopolysaccharide assembly protein LptE/RlpB|uniref:LPS assembly lipoprotein LptE n=1 Tax=Longimicrobium sp. TaxID=2029185 RepID=UPI002ED83DD9
MLLAFLKKRGARRALDAAALALVLTLGGCLYSFTGGGLPSHIRRVYIEPFENGTPYPGMESELLRQLQERFPGNLGVRLASQQTADAIVRGRLIRAEEQTTNYDPRSVGGRVNALERQVQISFDAEIYDVREDRVLWKGNGITALGTFDPGRESVEVGRRKALIEVVQKMVEGAQSQW